MKCTSKYFQLKFVVECKWPENHYFEVIAAFDNDQVATAYAKKCADDWRKKNSPEWCYRVQERRGSGKWFLRDTFKS
jgi:hypothetical protein